MRDGPGEGCPVVRNEGVCWKGRREASDEATEAASDEEMGEDC